ncbi:uncharacterized protein [Branchiostoma lanceolatum]|uniref:uncharacterized protein n=1 Tax=Branchiostoma lanceolatum TaxID=7740 RepID=UPI003454BA6A
MADNPRQDLYLEISRNLVDEELTDLRIYVSGANILPAGFAQKADAHQIFNQLEKERKLKPGDLSLLVDLLRKIGRHDYAEQAEKIAENERKGVLTYQVPRQDLYLEISRNLEDEEIRDLRNYVSGARLLPASFVQKADAYQIFNQLEKEQKLKPGELSLLADLLRKIGRHDNAEQVEKIAKDERRELSESSFLAKGLRWEETIQEFIFYNYVRLRKRLQVEKLIPHFIQRRLLDISDKQVIMSKTTTEGRTEALLDLLLAKGTCTPEVFVESLGLTDHQHVADELDSESRMMEKLADQLDEENVRRLLQVCPLSRQLKREMQESQKPRDLFKAMMELQYIKVDNLTMLKKDMITAGISWNAVVGNIPGVPTDLRQPMVEEADIGLGGGAVEIPHFIKLAVPAGALQQKTEVTISTVDFPGILIRSGGVHWSSGYPWLHAEAACSREMLDRVFFSPAFHVNLHGAKLTGKVPLEVQTWRPSGTADHKCIILHHDDITSWKDITAETETRVTEDQLVISLTQCSTIVLIWIPFVLFSSAAVAATSSSALAPVVGTAAVVTAGGHLVAQILDRSKEGKLKCWFAAYMTPANSPTYAEFHVLCKDGVLQQAFSYRRGFVHCGDNRSQVCLSNGESIDVHVKDASREHEQIESEKVVDADECRSPWGQQIQLFLSRELYAVGTVTIKRNKGTQDVCSLTFQQVRQDIILY